MKQRIIAALSAALLILSIIAMPTVGRAQSGEQEEVGGGYVLGSILLSALFIPLKLVTCVGTQAVVGVTYAATFGVPGNYDEGTNGREIGEVARRSCTGDWYIPAHQVKRDYGS
jgi:hypothetical protein